MASPLADQLRPNSLKNFYGQEHLVGKDKPIRRMLETNTVHSLIFWGPPGCGKTTLSRIIAVEVEAEFHHLSAVSAGKKELREICEQDAIKAKYDTEAKLKEYLGKQHGKFQTFKTKQAETKQKEEAKQQKLEDKAKADADPNKKRWNVKDASPDEAYDSAKEMISHSLAHSEEHGGKGLDEKSVKHMNTQLAVARKLMGSKNIDKLNNELKNDEIKPAQLDDEKVKEDYEGSDIPPEARGYGASPEGVKIYTGPEGGQFYDKREAEKKTGDGTGETKTGEDGKVEKLPEPSLPNEHQVSTE